MQRANLTINDVSVAGAHGNVTATFTVSLHPMLGGRRHLQYARRQHATVADKDL